MVKMIEVEGLAKSYGNIKAVKGIDFYVEKSKLFAFLGPNGAGKSTTIEILSTALKPDQGEVVINGYRLGAEDSKIRGSIGVVFQGHLLDDLLTVRENLLTRASFYGLRGQELQDAVQQAAHDAAVVDFIDQPYGKLSGGQQRRADIARALVNRPQILFLDEPTTGLDAQTRRTVWEFIRGLQEKNGMTVFLTTHYMEEAANADYVIVIDHGEIAAKGTPAMLKAEYATDQLRLHVKQIEEVRNILKEMELSYEEHADIITVFLAGTLEALPIIERCRDYILGFEVLQGTMDDAFIGITGKEMRS